MRTPVLTLVEVSRLLKNYSFKLSIAENVSSRHKNNKGEFKTKSRKGDEPAAIVVIKGAGRYTS